MIRAGGVPEEVYQQVVAVFDDGELAGLVWAAAVINAGNRFSISSRCTAVARW